MIGFRLSLAVSLVLLAAGCFEQPYEVECETDADCVLIPNWCESCPGCTLMRVANRATAENFRLDQEVCRRMPVEALCSCSVAVASCREFQCTVLRSPRLCIESECGESFVCDETERCEYVAVED